jgi:protein-L-isoaspartate(D-aspartate) O-methyltransferase
LQQIKIGGRILAVVGEPPVMSAQLITRTSDAAYDTVKLFETSIKPLRNIIAPSNFKF